jgi:ABC-type cobalamin/Fe3+-siderophores transport system ATPase subunit
MANRKVVDDDKEIRIGTILERPTSIGIVYKQSASGETTKILMIHKTKGLIRMSRETWWLQTKEFVKINDPEVGRHKMIRAAFKIKPNDII